MVTVQICQKLDASDIRLQFRRNCSCVLTLIGCGPWASSVRLGHYLLRADRDLSLELSDREGCSDCSSSGGGEPTIILATVLAIAIRNRW